MLIKEGDILLDDFDPEAEEIGIITDTQPEYCTVVWSDIGEVHIDYEEAEYFINKYKYALKDKYYEQYIPTRKRTTG